MAKNVRFIRTTKEKWLARDTYDPLALYFCEDTQEMCKGDNVLTDGIRVVPTKADLPECPYAADGVIYYIASTKSGYMMSPDRTEWLQTIYAPVEDVTAIPEGEIYKTVTTVGAVRDIENAIYAYVDQEIANVEIVAKPGKDGEDGKTPYIQDGYWYIDGVNTDVYAGGNTVTIIDISESKDSGGLNTVKFSNDTNLTIRNGIDGLSAYEIWLGNGHEGTEADFLDALKGENELLDTFDDVIASISCGGIQAGTSLKNKTIKDVLIMLLGIQEAPKSVVEEIISNSIPFYSGFADGGSSEVTYQQLDTATALYTDQGFYTTTNAVGEITNAGYQMTMEGNTENNTQTFAICANAKIITAYQYQPLLNQWLEMEFDGTYWVETGTDVKIVNGQEVIYTTYAYNTELMGDVITATEYWRFEVEVL